MNLRRRPLKTLAEATMAGGLHTLGMGVYDVIGDSSNVSPQVVDPVRDYERFRRRCPNYHEPWHAAYCPRCDSFPAPVGGVTYKHNDPRDDMADEISPAWPKT